MYGITSDATWDCPVCTVFNNLSVLQCAVCGANRPQEIDAMTRELERQHTEALIEDERQEKELQRIMSERLLNSANGGGDDWEVEQDDDGDIQMTEEDANAEFGPIEDMGTEEGKMDNIEGGGGDDDDGWADSDFMDGNTNIQNADNDVEVKETFDILSPGDLVQIEKKEVKGMQEVLNLKDLEDVAIVCRFYRWNKAKIMDEYPVNPDEIQKKSGIVSSKRDKPTPATETELDCMLCVRTVPIKSTFALSCNHRYCNECWTAYLESEMEKGPRVIDTRCIEPKCRQIIKPPIFRCFLSAKKQEKFEQFLINSFVEGHKNLAWCPGKDCTFAAKAEAGSAITIACKCGHAWCFGCRNEAHSPCDCALASKWLNLCSTDKENVTYIRAYAKQCPKCHSFIEKNQGCNHMTCRCGYEFCWLCKQDWKKTGYGHTCNKPSDVIAMEEEANRAETQLKRYMFYFSRYETHEKSSAAAKKSLENSKETVRQFIATNSNLKYQDVAFIIDAVTEIILTKRVLQWSYCFGYYLANGTKEKDLFETQQGLLESFADRLHEKAEKRVDNYDSRRELLDLAVRQELINLTKTVTKYRTNLSNDLLEMEFVWEKGLK